MLKNNKRKIFLPVIFLFIPSFVFAAIVEPNDEFYNYQKDYFSQIRLQEAWQETTGSSQTVIAIIDSGVDMDHQDIIGNMWFNRGEIPLNGIDDDNNGYVDDLNGWDFLDNTSDPHPKFSQGYNFIGINHGTAVAGTAASVSNNSIGMAGVCWNCKIMALRAADSKGNIESKVISKAVDYAINNGADIINMSFVSKAYDDILEGALRRAHDAGLLVVAAVGNDAEYFFLSGGDLDLNPAYPVCLDGGEGKNNILGVGSVDLDNNRSSFSNYGISCLDINAPGRDILAPLVYDPKRGEDYSSGYLYGWSGTSIAAPIVSGVAGLIKSAVPSITNDQIISIIRETGKNIGSSDIFLSGKLGCGIIDAKAAVSLAKERFKTAKILISPQKNYPSEIIISDKNGFKSAEWLAYPNFFKGGSEIVSGDIDGDGNKEIIVAAGDGGGPQVRIFDRSGNVKFQFFAYDPSLRGGVHVASADMDGDGKWEIITLGGRGYSDEVRIFDQSGQILKFFKIQAGVISDGSRIAAGDVDKDGKVEIIIGSGKGSLPMIQVFDIVGNRKYSWLAYSKFFKGGVNVAVGDVDSDGEAEIITSPGNGGGPQIRVFDKNGNPKWQFFAFEESFRGGASVSVGNIDSDSDIEIIAGSGSGRAPEVRIFRLFGSNFVQESSFEVFETNFEGGVNVGI